MDISSTPQSDLAPEIARLAARYGRANGPVMALVNRMGGSLEGRMALLPLAMRQRLEAVVAQALSASYGVAGLGPDLGDQAPMAAAVASGALGGSGGLASSLAELPVTITLMLHAIRREAQAAGFDPALPEVRAECLRVFAAGSPMAEDDGVNTAFLSARLTLTGTAMHTVIASVAPKLAAAMGQKLVAQAIPVLGAVTGAALNAAYLGYFREMARIRFALLRLAEMYGAEPVMQAFSAAVKSAPVRTARGA